MKITLECEEMLCICLLLPRENEGKYPMAGLVTLIQKECFVGALGSAPEEILEENEKFHFSQLLISL